MKTVINGYEIEIKTHSVSVDKKVFVCYKENFHLLSDKELSEFLTENGYDAKDIGRQKND